MSEDLSPPAPAHLSARIREILARGVTVGPDVQAFIESTLPIADPGGLAGVLTREAAAEIEPVVALLFYPDEGFQLEIEETLAGRSLTTEEELRLAERLAAPPPQVSFVFPGGRDRLPLEMTPERVRQFLRHLRLSRALPKKLDDTITVVLAPADRNRFRVLWRNGRCPASTAAVGFIGQLLRHASPRDRDGWSRLGFILEFLAEAGDETDIYRRLAARKTLLVNALNRSRRQQAELARGTMETLISRGLRLIALDEKEACRHVAWIDQVCLALYGRMEAIDIDRVTLYESDN